MKVFGTSNLDSETCGLEQMTWHASDTPPRRKLNYGSPSFEMDRLTYVYNTTVLRNQLRAVRDAVAAGQFSGDFDNMTAAQNHIFQYDASGRMTTDTKEGMTIHWFPFDKPRQIVKGGSTVSYGSDALHQRVEKIESSTRTAYVRDAQGNILAVYALVSGIW